MTQQSMADDFIYKSVALAQEVDRNAVSAFSEFKKTKQSQQLVMDIRAKMAATKVAIPVSTLTKQRRLAQNSRSLFDNRQLQLNLNRNGASINKTANVPAECELVLQEVDFMNNTVNNPSASQVKENELRK
jgi:pyocin large subunit-like protein